jgi:hypothetical protein
MCPLRYYPMLRQSKDPTYLRFEMVRYAKEFGIKACARQFSTTVKTVRKWLRHWQRLAPCVASKTRAALRITRARASLRTNAIKSSRSSRSCLHREPKESSATSRFLSQLKPYAASGAKADS